MQVAHPIPLISLFLLCFPNRCCLNVKWKVGRVEIHMDQIVLKVTKFLIKWKAGCARIYTGRTILETRFASKYE